jgi:hypothetical protein
VKQRLNSIVLRVLLLLLLVLLDLLQQGDRFDPLTRRRFLLPCILSHNPRQVHSRTRIGC